MLLKTLSMINIRSYTNETIHFPHGSIMLSGDIGSGKSTILLAIEFALFGAAPPDLPAETLLRKGAASGSVHLTFELNGTTYHIERHLKKERETIKQTSGSITKNDTKKELTAEELKSEIINLLGYPEDQAAKRKNNLFRFTLYTPQEEMKNILQGKPEERLETLRKLFNLEKYQTIRENAGYYLKRLRSNINLYEMKLEPYREIAAQKESIEIEITELKNQLSQASETQRITQSDLTKIQNQVLEFELAQKQIQSLFEELKITKALLREKTEQITATQNQLKELDEERRLLRLPQDGSESTQKTIIQELEEQKNQLLTSKMSIEARLLSIQTELKEHKTRIELLENDLKNRSHEERLISEFANALERKHILEEEHKQLIPRITQLTQISIKNKSIIDHARELQNRVRELQECPTCLQAVTQVHKHTIIQTEQQKIAEIEEEYLKECQELHDITDRIKNIEENLKELTKQELEFTRLKQKLLQTKEKEEQKNQSTSRLRELIEENNQLIARMSNLQIEQNLQRIIKRINEQQELLQIYTKARSMENQMRSMEGNIVQYQTSYQLLQNKKNELELKLTELEDPIPKLESKKRELQTITKIERDNQTNITRLETTITQKNLITVELHKKLVELNSIKSELTRLQDISYWLEEHFLSLTITIEKHLMVTIHRAFNGLFQEWFSLLMDDETIRAKIDETFSPIVEQNGHEVPYHTLSGGEKTSCALAYRLALNRVINDVVHTIKTKDILILDEPTDGFSSEQLDKVREVLDRLKLNQIIIVSHETKVESFVDHVIRIEKTGHISKINC